MLLSLAERRRARNIHSESQLEALFPRRPQAWGLPMPRAQRRVHGPASEARQRDRTKRNLLTVQGRAVLQLTWEDLTDRAKQTRALLTPLFSMPEAVGG